MVEGGEACEHADDHDNKERGQQQRKGDMDEDLPGRGTVDPRGLDGLARDRSQADEQEHHGQADRLPDESRDDGRGDRRFLEQPAAVGGAAKAGQHPVQHAVGGIDIVPDHAHGGGGEHAGQEEQRLGGF